MGFDEDRARVAAARSSSVDEALELLTARTVEQAAGDFLDWARSLVVVNPERVKMREKLMVLGFSDTDIAFAMSRCSSIEAAVDFLAERDDKKGIIIEDAVQNEAVQKEAQSRLAALEQVLEAERASLKEREMRLVEEEAKQLRTEKELRLEREGLE